MMRFWWRVGLVGLLLVGFIAPAYAQEGNPDLPQVTLPTDHPRLLLTQNYIEQTLAPRLESDGNTFFAYVDSTQPEADLTQDPPQVTRSLAAAYLVTGKKPYADRAKNGVLKMVQYLETHPAAVGGGTWDETFIEYVAGLAIAYDWLHETFTPLDRDALAKVLLKSAALLNDPAKDNGRAYLPTPEGTYRFASYDHWGAQILWATAAAGLALYGDTVEAVALVDYARNLFKGWMLPTLEELSGGSWAEGLPAGWMANWANIQTATLFWTALGENYFDDTRWWYDRLAYDLFARYPARQHLHNQPADLSLWGYPSVIGSGARYSAAEFEGRAQDMLLATLFQGTDYAGWMNWFLGQGDATLQGKWAVEEFLWRDPTASAGAFPPPGLLWFTAGTGQAFLRSDWDLESNATVYMSFNAGDHFAREQFFDQGNLTLARGGDDLIVRAGVYSGGTDSDHDANFYGRSVAANVPLICDLAENFDYILPNSERQVWLNDCGQRPVLNPSAINPFYKQNNHAAYETGTILRFSEEGNLNYFRADLTPAYNSTVYTAANNRPKVSEVLREFVYVRPGLLVVHDRMAVTDAQATVIDPFHTQTEPQNEGGWWRVQNGASAVYVRGLAPQNRAQVVEGYQVEGEEIDPDSNAYETAPYGAYTLQFIPSEPRSNHFFLTVFWVGDQNLVNPPPTSYIEGDGVYGVSVNEWQIMFDDDAGNITNTRFGVLDGITNVLMTGLEPLGSYQVTLTTGNTTNLLADEAGTLFIFTEASGEIRLRKR